MMAGSMPALRRAGMVLLMATALLMALGWAVIDRSAALAIGEAQTQPTGDGPYHERDERPDAPTISFIDSQTR